jgi:DNA-binding CsgD family transcriptional regulator
MLYTEWKWEDAITVAKKEARVKGIKEGEARLLALLEKGIPLAEVKRKLSISRNHA